MGCHISVEASQVFNRTVTLVGLDGAGKSAIAFRMVTSDSGQKYVPISTAGVAYWELPMGGSTFRIYDCGGLGRYRYEWPYYMKQSDAVVFVIDRSDKERMGRVREEIAEVIKECASLQIPLLVLVNKVDLKSKLTVQDIATITKLNEARLQDSVIKECSAETGDGIVGARDWLLQHIKPKVRNVQQQAAVAVQQ